MTPAPSEWDRLGNIHYQRRHLYSFNDVSIHGSNSAAAVNGGAFAVQTAGKSTNVANSALDSTQRAQHFTVYSSSGHHLCGIAYPSSSELITFGWTREELLVCVHGDGRVVVHDLQGKLTLDAYPLRGAKSGDEALIRCKVWEKGIVAVTVTNKIFLVSDIHSNALKVTQLESPETSGSVCALDVKVTSSGGNKVDAEVFFARGDTVTASHKSTGSRYQTFGGGRPVALCLSPNGQFLTIFTSLGKMLVVTCDFSRTVSEFDAKSSSPPEQLAWCGSDAAVMYWPTYLIIMGPFENFISYVYDAPAKLISESDGLRVITSSGHELVSRVPDAIVETSDSDSTKPVVALQNAVKQHAKRQLFSDVNEPALRDEKEIDCAILGCVRAACHEFDTKRQSELLRAAHFGNSYLERKNRHVDCWALHKTCVMLRIMNAVRSPEVGIPLTYAQYCQDGLENLVKRLNVRKQHLLASRISECTKGCQDVIEHWALSHITASSSKSDDALLEKIKPKLETLRGASYGKITLAAHRANRHALVQNLIDMEQNSYKQVSLLISIGADENALLKAIESRDADLMYTALLNLQRSMTFQDLASLLSRNPTAKALFVAFCKRTDVELLKSFFYSSGETAKGGQALLSQAFCSSARDAEAYVWDEGSASLCAQASTMYGKLKDEFHEKTLDEAQRLIRLGMDTQLEIALSGVPQKSIAVIVKHFIRNGELKEAQKIRAAFGVSDRHFYWLHASVLASKRDWRALETLASEKNCPLGALALLELGERYGAPKVELAKYLARLPNTRQRAVMFAEVGLEDQITRVEPHTFATKAAGFFSAES